jgi:hypothetical protein
MVSWVGAIEIEVGAIEIWVGAIETWVGAIETGSCDRGVSGISCVKRD